MTKDEEQDTRMDTMSEGHTSRTASEVQAGSQRSPTPNQVSNEP
jgi:hypothetical protein